MKLLQDLLIEDIFTKVCPPSKVLMLRRTSKKFKDAIDDMSIKVQPPFKRALESAHGLSVQSSSETLESAHGLSVQSTSETLESVHGLTVHLKLYGFGIDNIYINLKNMHKNYIITKIEFIRYNMFMFIDLDKISILCPSLNHLDLGPYDFDLLSLNKFQKNMPKCKIIHNYTFGQENII